MSLRSSGLRLLRQIECPIHGVRIPCRRYVGDRRLDPRVSGPMAVAAPPLAI